MFVVLIVSFVMLMSKTSFGHDDIRILSGKPVLVNESLSFFAQIVVADKYLCGGTVISENAVLTAAKCLSGSINNYQVYVGDLSLYKGDKYQAIHLIKHPKYNEKTHEHDIGILLTTEPIIFKQSSVELLELSDRDSPIPTNHFVLIMGFGASNESLGVTLELREALAKVIPNKKCIELYNKAYLKPENSDNHFCTGFLDNTGPCSLDEGGPAIYQNRLAGIVSWANGCGRPEYPRIYTFVPKYRDWILDNIASKTNIPTYVVSNNTKLLQYNIAYLVDSKQTICVTLILSDHAFLTSSLCISRNVNVKNFFIFHNAFYEITEVLYGHETLPELTDHDYDVILIKSKQVKLLEPYKAIARTKSNDRIERYKFGSVALKHTLIQNIDAEFVQVEKQTIDIELPYTCQQHYGKVIPFVLKHTHFCLTSPHGFMSEMQSSPVFNGVDELIGLVVWQGVFRANHFAVALFTPKFLSNWGLGRD